MFCPAIPPPILPLTSIFVLEFNISPPFRPIIPPTIPTYELDCILPLTLTFFIKPDDLPAKAPTYLDSPPSIIAFCIFKFVISEPSNIVENIPTDE